MEKWEQKTLTNELLQGMELAKHLQGHLITASSPETRELLVQRILTSYEKALSVLNWNGATGQTPTVGATANAPESPLSINGSPWRESFDEGLQDHQENKHVSKKRKSMPTWTDQVRINSENGFEGSREDGYNWRKYGQKDILGAKYPRSYYRCTFQKIQKCLATKQVQRSEDDPSVFHITYRGKHTCIHANQSIPAPASPEKQDNNCNNHQLYQSQESQFNFRANLRVNTDLENKETETPFPLPSTSFGCMEREDHIFLPSVDNNNLLSCYSPSFFSPSTPETDYFSIPSCQMNYYGMDQNLRSSASDLTEIISTNTSTTSSPILNLDFSLDPVEIDPYFPFDNPGFFSQSTKFGN